MALHSRWVAKCPRCARSHSYKTYLCRNCCSAFLLDTEGDRGRGRRFERLVCSRRCGNAPEGLKCQCGGWITCTGLRYVQPIALEALRAILLYAAILLVVFGVAPLIFEHVRAWVVTH